MQLLGSSEWLPESCYMVNMIFLCVCVIARELCGCYDLQGGCQRVAMQLLCGDCPHSLSINQYHYLS